MFITSLFRRSDSHLPATGHETLQSMKTYIIHLVLEFIVYENELSD